MSFETDIQGQNTQLYPIITIEPPDAENREHYGVLDTECIFISTNNVSLDHIHSLNNVNEPRLYGRSFKPLLLNIPSIKESIDIESRKFKISNVSLDISNYEYEGKRFTDILSDTSLINWKCSIQFVSPNAKWFSTIFGVQGYAGYNYASFYEVYNTLGFYGANTDFTQDKKDKMTQMVYQGIIRRISHDDTKVKIELEDLTEKLAHKYLPQQNAPDKDFVSDKYRNKPIPMVYGDVDRSPVVILSSKAVPDTNFISGYNSEPLYIRLNDTYVNVPEYIIEDFNDAFLEIGDEEEEIEYSALDIQFEKIDSTLDNIDAELLDLGVNSLLNANLMQIQVKNRKPEGLSHSTILNIADTQIPISYDDSQMQLITDGDDSTSVENINETDSWWYSGEGYDTVFYKQSIFGGESPLDFNDIDGNVSRNSNFFINGFNIKDISLGGASPYHPSFSTFPTDYNAQYTDIDGNDLFGLFTYNIDEYNNGHRDFYFNAEVSEVNSPDSFYHFTEIAQYSYIQRLFYIHADNFGGLRILTGFIQHEHYQVNLDYQFRIREIKRDDWGNIKNPLKNNFYANVKGRINTFDDHPELNTEYGDDPVTTDIVETDYLISGDLIENPIDIIYDLVRSELGHDAIDEVEYAEAKEAHNGWKFGFTVNKKINSKKLIEDIAKSTKCFPKFKNDGTFGFNTIKDSYTVEDSYENGDYENATQIKESEVISYSFKKTKPEQIYKKVDVQYNKDYAQDSYLKRTVPIGTGELYASFPELWWRDMYYGIETWNDAHLEFESDYIRHDSATGAEQTADKLASFLSQQYRNDHLLFNLKLPLQYINLEIGDLVKFRELFGGVNAYGIDYRVIQNLNAQYYYPLFMVTATTKNLDSVSIECMQLHHLSGDVEGEADASGWFDGLVLEDLWGVGVMEFNRDGLFYFPDSDTVYITPPEEEPTEEPFEGESWVIPVGSFELGWSDDSFIEFLYSWGGYPDNSNYIFDWTVDEGLVSLFNTTNEVGNTRRIRIEVEGNPLYANYEIVGGVNPIITNDNNADFSLNLRFLDSYNGEDPIRYNVFTHNHNIIITEISFESTMLMGDVNLDGTLNALDLVGVINWIRGTGAIQSEYNADANQDGVVNVLDIVRMVNCILGTGSCDFG